MRISTPQFIQFSQKNKQEATQPKPDTLADKYQEASDLGLLGSPAVDVLDQLSGVPPKETDWALKGAYAFAKSLQADGHQDE
jgi:protein-disulfide isomerase